MTPSVFRGSVAASFVLVSTPALADHTGLGSGLSQSGPIVTIAADALPAGSIAGSLTATFTDPDAYTDAELVDFASRHIHAHTTDYSLQGSATLAYGLNGHITLAARLPYVRRENLRAGEHSHAGGVASNTVEVLGTVDGIGDLTLLSEYLFAHDHHAGWGVALIAGVKAPTGATHRTNRDGERLETEHQPGTGSWDPLLGLAAEKAWRPFSLHASGLYQFSTQGVQQTELGDRLNVDVAAVRALGSRLAIMLEGNYEHEGRERVAGALEEDTGAEVLYFSPGVRFGGASGWTATLSAGIPVW